MAKKLKTTALGNYLADLRNAKGYTLREVESLTDKEVSNGYLSQLEHGKISKPSPNVLYGLAGAYGVSYETLMEKAGYISASSQVITEDEPVNKKGFSIEDLTEDEEQELLKYLSFLRSRSSKS